VGTLHTQGAPGGLDWMLDAFWSSEGLDPNSRPPLNAVVEWLAGGAIGLGTGWFVTRLFGDN